MTEAEWLACELPEAMLAVVPAEAVRKLRLFAIACCERIDHFITDPRSRAALDFAIRHIETPINRQKGRKSIEKVGRDAWSDAYSAGFTHGADRPACLVRSCAADAAVQAMSSNPKLGAGYASSFACFAVAWKAVSESKPPVAFDITDELKAPEFAAQAHLLRDIFGNPFRKVKCRPSWLTSDVQALAKGIYAEKAFDRMPILADALQDAGCDNDDILNHCRDASVTHVRGCWWSTSCWARSDAVTEAEWLVSKDPEELFKLVNRTRRTSQRVFRLFAAGFWRWQEARLKPGDRGVLARRIPKLEQWAETGKPPKGVLPNVGPTVSFFEPRARNAAQNAVNLGSQWREAAVNRILCVLIREVFGNPFRKVKLDPRWLTSDVVALAKGIYDDRAFDRMPILADALQDAGCNSDDILNHCRDAKQVHVRGCWVVDLVLGNTRAGPA